MKVHVFRGPGRIFSITTLSTGDNLPQKYAPWTFLKAIELHQGEPIAGIDVNQCLGDLEAFGVHITDAHARITEDAIR